MFVPKKRRIILLSALLSLGFSLVFCYTSSPLSTYAGYDSAVFRLIGQGMTRGLLPYKDLFDHKGPILYFIQYFGQILNYGREGIFVIEWLNTFFCLLLIAQIFSVYQIRTPFMTLTGIGVFLWLASFQYEGGNLTEEYSLVPLFISILLFSDFCNKQTDTGDASHCKYYSLIYGLCFGWIAFIRINNAILICVIMFLVCLNELIHKRNRRFFENILFFLLGAGIVALPVFLYLKINNIIGEMISSYFLFNFLYSSDTGMIEHLRKTLSTPIPLFLFIIPFTAAFLLKVRNWMERLFLILGSFLTLISLSMGYNHLHYYILSIPFVVLSIAVFFRGVSSVKGFTRPQIFIAAVFLIILLFQPESQLEINKAKYYFLKETGTEEREFAKDIHQWIPKSERNSVYGYNIWVDFYLNTNLFPCNRYFYDQNRLISINPSINDELVEFFEQTPPKWMVLTTLEMEIPEELKESISEQYQVVSSNKKYTLYQHQSSD